MSSTLQESDPELPCTTQMEQELYVAALELDVVDGVPIVQDENSFEDGRRLQVRSHNIGSYAASDLAGKILTLGEQVGTITVDNVVYDLYRVESIE